MSVFSDERVIEALKDFIPVAEDCRFTQVRFNWHKERWETDELAQFYRSIVQKAEHLRRITEFTFEAVTREAGQGLYTFDAEGEAFGGHNDQRPERVLRLLEDAKRRYDAKTKKKLGLSSYPDLQREPPPRGTTIFRTYTRIDPVPSGASPRNAFVGRDYMWLLPQETEMLAKGEFPASLKGRIVRLQLFDNVRGIPAHWKPEHVQLAEFRAYSKPNEDGTLFKIELEGKFRLVAPYGRGEAQEGFPLPETGYEGRLDGELLYSPLDGIIEGMLYADGTHWGRSRFNPEAPEGKFPLKVAFVLATDDAARRVSPWGTNSGMKEYLNPAMP